MSKCRSYPRTGTWIVTLNKAAGSTLHELHLDLNAVKLSFMYSLALPLCTERLHVQNYSHITGGWLILLQAPTFFHSLLFPTINGTKRGLKKGKYTTCDHNNGNYAYLTILVG